MGRKPPAGGGGEGGGGPPVGNKRVKAPTPDKLKIVAAAFASTLFNA